VEKSSSGTSFVSGVGICFVFFRKKEEKRKISPFSLLKYVMASNEEPVLSDEQILEFEQLIKDEEAQKVFIII
jgi:hypothetical protein